MQGQSSTTAFAMLSLTYQYNILVYFTRKTINPDNSSQREQTHKKKNLSVFVQPKIESLTLTVNVRRIIIFANNDLGLVLQFLILLVIME